MTYALLVVNFCTIFLLHLFLQIHIDDDVRFIIDKKKKVKQLSYRMSEPFMDIKPLMS